MDDDQTVLTPVFELEWLLEQSASDAPATMLPPACNWSSDHMSIAVYLREAGVVPTPAAIESALKHARTLNAMLEMHNGHRAAYERWGADSSGDIEYDLELGRYESETIRPRRNTKSETELLEYDLRQNEWHR